MNSYRRAQFRGLQIRFHLDSLITFLGLPTRILRRLLPPPVYYKRGRKQRYSAAGCLWSLDLSDHVQREIAVNSLSFSRSLTNRLCQEGEAVLDVGANRGNYCIPLVKQLKKSSKIYAFEPNPSIYSSLNAHIALNKIPNDRIVTQQLAIGNECSTLTIKQPKSNSGATTAVIDIPKHDVFAQFEVPVKTLDILFSNHDIGFIKIDVEGMDADVLEGGMDLIKRCKPSIYIEVSDKTIVKISKLLKEQAYSLYFVEDDSRKLHKDINRSVSWGNMLAVSPEREHLLGSMIEL